MKPTFAFIIPAALVCVLLLMAFQKDQTTDPWSKAQLMPAAELARQIDNDAPNLAVFDIGPSGTIKNAVAIGPAQEQENMKALKNKLAELPKNTNVVIYCGCCPFAHCPNIRPAFTLAENMGFASVRLLNLPKNLKVDWIDKGYPMKK